jgi:hypothetical protein
MPESFLSFLQVMKKFTNTIHLPNLAYVFAIRFHRAQVDPGLTVTVQSLSREQDDHLKGRSSRLKQFTKGSGHVSRRVSQSLMKIYTSHVTVLQQESTEAFYIWRTNPETLGPVTRLPHRQET